jgi:hypothetical protein
MVFREETIPPLIFDLFLDGIDALRFHGPGIWKARGLGFLIEGRSEI